jgi:hypothetical protein
VYRLLVGKLEGKRPLGRPRCRCINNIKMDFLETGLGELNCIGLAQDMYKWRARELGNEPLGSIKCWNLPSGCATCAQLQIS